MSTRYGVQSATVGRVVCERVLSVHSIPVEIAIHWKECRREQRRTGPNAVESVFAMASTSTDQAQVTIFGDSRRSERLEVRAVKILMPRRCDFIPGAGEVGGMTSLGVVECKMAPVESSA